MIFEALSNILWDKKNSLLVGPMGMPITHHNLQVQTDVPSCPLGVSQEGRAPTLTPRPNSLPLGPTNLRQFAQWGTTSLPAAHVPCVDSVHCPTCPRFADPDTARAVAIFFPPRIRYPANVASLCWVGMLSVDPSSAIEVNRLTFFLSASEAPRRQELRSFSDFSLLHHF